MRGQIAYIYQDGKSTWVGCGTGIKELNKFQYIDLDNGKIRLVDEKYELGEIISENVFDTIENY